MTAVAIVLITLIIVDSANDDGDKVRVAQSPTAATLALGSVLHEGTLALSLKVPPATAEGSLVMPGDWVDVQAPDDASAVRTILESVQVLSVGQQQQRPFGPDGTDTTVVPVDTNRAVTLAVTPEGAQLLAGAQESAAKLMLSHSPIALPDQYQ